MQTIWPNLIVQRELNTLGVRHIVPNGPHSMIMLWTMFGYETDDEEMTRHRLRQGNLMGPSGFLGLEDNEAIKFVQEGVRRSPSDRGILKLGGDRAGHHQLAHRRGGDPRHVRPLPQGDGTLDMYRATTWPPLDPRTARELRLEIEEFHADYCWTLDCGDAGGLAGATSPRTRSTASRRARTRTPACRSAWCTPTPRR